MDAQPVKRGRPAPQLGGLLGWAFILGGVSLGGELSLVVLAGVMFAIGLVLKIAFRVAGPLRRLDMQAAATPGQASLAYRAMFTSILVGNIVIGFVYDEPLSFLVRGLIAAGLATGMLWVLEPVLAGDGSPSNPARAGTGHSR